MPHSEKQTGADKLMGKVMRLADLVDYQDGAMVSKVLTSTSLGQPCLPIKYVAWQGEAFLKLIAGSTSPGLIDKSLSRCLKLSPEGRFR